MGIRGALEETKANSVNYPGTYVAGVYNTLESLVGDKKIYNEDFVNCPDLFHVMLKIGKEDWIDLHHVKINEISRQLDFRTGALCKRMVITDKLDRTTRIESERFVSMKSPYIAEIRYTATPLNYSDKITLRSVVNTDITNAGVDRYKNLSSRHIQHKQSEGNKTESSTLVITTQSNINIAICSSIKALLNNLNNPYLNINYPASAVHELEHFVNQNESFGFEKAISLSSSNNNKNTFQATAKRELKKVKTYDDTLIESTKKWSDIWNKADIKIEGDRLTQKLLRLHIYHLLVSASPHNTELDAGITARGLHGEAYRGHIFWDELFILPFYSLYFPDIAKSLLMYRYRRLEKAKENAKEAGYNGAMYPWDSASDGSEQTQIMHLNPISGEWGDDYSSLQRHVNLAITYNIWQYYWYTNDIDFLEKYGAEMFFEICRFWESKAILNNSTGRYEIKNVMGPDEFHEKYADSNEGGLKDNFYTNVMVAWTFKKAAGIYEILADRRDLTGFKNLLGLASDEIDRWLDIARHINLPISEEGIFEQYDGYFKLKEIEWDYYKEKYGNVHRMDRLLKAENKSPDEYKVSKQADVLMTYYNLDESEINTILKEAGYSEKLTTDNQQLSANFEYYFKRTSHGSTLSSIVHSYLANLAGDKELGWHLYRNALTSDYEDIQGGTTAEGVHTGVMAAR